MNDGAGSGSAKPTRLNPRRWRRDHVLTDQGELVVHGRERVEREIEATSATAMTKKIRKLGQARQR